MSSNRHAAVTPRNRLSPTAQENLLERRRIFPVVIRTAARPCICGRGRVRRPWTGALPDAILTTLIHDRGKFQMRFGAVYPSSRGCPFDDPGHRLACLPESLRLEHVVPPAQMFKVVMIRGSTLNPGFGVINLGYHSAGPAPGKTAGPVPGPQPALQS
jgi:hypothetical protein